MGLLSAQDIARYALAHGRVFQYSCDEPNCGKLIPVGSLCVITKYAKKDPLLPKFLGKQPKTVRCMTCQNEMYPVKTEVTVRGAKATISREESTKLNDSVRKTVMSLLKKLPEGKTLSHVSLLNLLKRRKNTKDVKRREVLATLRLMRKLKLVKYKAKTWALYPQKKGKVKKTKRRKKKVSA